MAWETAQKRRERGQQERKPLEWRQNATWAHLTRRTGGVCWIGNGFAAALTEFGVAYAEQTERDWEALRAAEKRKK